MKFPFVILPIHRFRVALMLAHLTRLRQLLFTVSPREPTGNTKVHPGMNGNICGLNFPVALRVADGGGWSRGGAHHLPPPLFPFRGNSAALNLPEVAGSCRSWKELDFGKALECMNLPMKWGFSGNVRKRLKIRVSSVRFRPSPPSYKCINRNDLQLHLSSSQMAPRINPRHFPRHCRILNHKRCMIRVFHMEG